jgi:phosphopantetheine--protein transferase-like protein
MIPNTFPFSVRCSFYPEREMESDYKQSGADIYFGQTKDLSREILFVNGCINRDDTIKAEKLHNSKDKDTTLVCYTLLRLILSSKLNRRPDEIHYRIGKKGKPELMDDSLFFNISHTSDSFVIAISESCPVGVDLEDLNKHLNYMPIVKRFFSEEEAGYILSNPEESKERFFLLWTRKEALLKAIGTGIIPHFSRIEVFRSDNLIDRGAFEDLTDDSLSNQYFIYSKKLHNHFLSIALPYRTNITFSCLNRKYFNTLLKLGFPLSFTR